MMYLYWFSLHLKCIKIDEVIWVELANIWQLEFDKVNISIFRLMRSWRFEVSEDMEAGPTRTVQISKYPEMI